MFSSSDLSSCALFSNTLCTIAPTVLFSLIFQQSASNSRTIIKIVQGNTKWQRDIILNKIEVILLKRLVRLMMTLFLEWTAQVLFKFALTQATQYPVCSPSSYNGLIFIHFDTDAVTAGSQEQLSPSDSEKETTLSYKTTPETYFQSVSSQSHFPRTWE